MLLRLGVDRYSNIVILTGAGVSAGSGLPTYRGPGGLWTPELAKQATVEAFEADPTIIWRLFGPMRLAVQKAEPNEAHRALMRLSQRKRITLITQNVDGLHQRAGHEDVVERHGNITRTRCANDRCGLRPFHDEAAHLEELPRCPECASPLRPDIVLFGEMIPAEAGWRAKRSLRDVDLFLAVGTSGTVAPAAGFARSARYAGARTVLVNLEPMEHPDPNFGEELLGKAEDLLPVLLD